MTQIDFYSDRKPLPEYREWTLDAPDDILDIIRAYMKLKSLMDYCVWTAINQCVKCNNYAKGVNYFIIHVTDDTDTHLFCPYHGMICEAWEHPEKPHKVFATEPDWLESEPEFIDEDFAEFG
jgi:hypothetical protein